MLIINTLLSEIFNVNYDEVFEIKEDPNSFKRKIVMVFPDTDGCYEIMLYRDFVDGKPVWIRDGDSIFLENILTGSFTVEREEDKNAPKPLKLYVSQPMSDKSNEEIIAVREKAVKDVENKLGKHVELIDSFFKDTPHEGVQGVWYLGKSLQKMSEADIVYFTKDWENYKGCGVEHDVARKYKMKVMYYYECEGEQ